MSCHLKESQGNSFVKEGPQSDPINWRPISVLQIMSKVLEWSTHNTISSDILANNLLQFSLYGWVHIAVLIVWMGPGNHISPT